MAGEGNGDTGFRKWRFPMPDPSSLFEIAPDDSVAVALVPLAKGMPVVIGGNALTASAEIPAGHKVALKAHATGGAVIKYGHLIGRATDPIAVGDSPDAARARLPGTNAQARSEHCQ